MPLETRTREFSHPLMTPKGSTLDGGYASKFVCMVSNGGWRLWRLTPLSCYFAKRTGLEVRLPMGSGTNWLVIVDFYFKQIYYRFLSK